jgi:hypothetical protein
LPSSPHTQTVCPNSVAIHTLTFGCGGGGGGTGNGYAIPTPFGTLEQGISAVSSRLDDYTTTGSSTDSYGNAFSSTSGSVSQDVTDGTDYLTLNIPSYGLNNVTMSRLDVAYFDLTQNPVDTGNGLMVSMDQTTLDSSTSFQVNGQTYNVNGAPDTDGTHYDITLTTPDGSSETYQFNPTDFYPPDPPSTTSSTGIKPAETCTAGLYCPSTITVQQGFQLTAASAAFFQFLAIVVPVQPAKGIAQMAAFVTGAAAADLAQQAAQQKKKKTTKR